MLGDPNVLSRHEKPIDCSLELFGAVTLDYVLFIETFDSLYAPASESRGSYDHPMHIRCFRKKALGNDCWEICRHGATSQARRLYLSRCIAVITATLCNCFKRSLARQSVTVGHFSGLVASPVIPSARIGMRVGYNGCPGSRQ